MERKPNASGYDPDKIKIVKQLALHLATIMGDLQNDLIVVGGCVPALLIDQPEEGTYEEKHVGTRDLDIGFSIRVLDDELYDEIANRLETHDFQRTKKDDGNLRSHRWKTKKQLFNLSVDFLVGETSETPAAGKTQNLAPNFSAVVVPGIDLAFEDKKKITLKGETFAGNQAERDIYVCGPASFVVLKGLALKRGENKDAYDLYYFIRNYSKKQQSLARKLKNLEELDEEEYVAEAIKLIKRDFQDTDYLGPGMVAEFMLGENYQESDREEKIRADSYIFIKQFVDKFEEESTG